MADYISKYPDGAAVDAKLDKIAEPVETQGVLQTPASAWMNTSVNRVKRNSDGFVNVEFAGVFTSGSGTIGTGVAIMQLPSGFRPGGNIFFNIFTRGSSQSTTPNVYPAFIDSSGMINSGGNIPAATTIVVYISASFYAQQ